MKKSIPLLLSALLMGSVALDAQTPQPSATEQNSVTPQRLASFIHWYPAIEQAKMRDEWLQKYKQGEWQFTGMVTAKDRTVITPQADVNYGYSWFNISKEPVVITMPKYDKYYSLSIFDMNHFMEVHVMPNKPVVIRLPHQKSPVKDAIEVVLHTYWGLAFTRQAIVNNEKEVMGLAKKITIKGGGGDFPYIVPDFTPAEREAGMKAIKKYSFTLKNGRKLFGSLYEGVGDMDRAAGVFLGQLGTQARYVDYAQDIADQNGQKLNGHDSYQITVPVKPLTRNSKGYWSYTIYNMQDRYLIPNPKNKYVISSYDAVKNSDGTVTININPKGVGKNVLPSNGKPFYGIFRVYEPVQDVVFPKIKKID